MILFVNACVRSESRTKTLADALIKKLADECEELKLEEVSFPKTDEAFLSKRDSLIEARNFDDEAFAPARQFAEAKTIVIAAPYWDLSFPAMLKQYIEHINVLGITFEYTPEGIPKGLCKADKLYYVTTAGGNYVPDDFGFGYIKALAQNFYGIKDVKLIKASGLDIYGANTKAIMKEAVEGITL
ncbi:MAG: NAD(P)H-dependent oxidoreductase [Schwartzia sp.]|nr:NAD(P)H-dependent oxidoreductase [Schwartzia sp. (in: firmicutes)]